MAFSRFLLKVSGAIVSLVAVIGAFALLVLISAAIIRVIVPDAEIVSGTALSGPVRWAQSLHAPAGADEAQAARVTSLQTRVWLVNCGLATIDAEDIAQGTNPNSNPVWDRLRPLASELYEDRVSLARSADNSFATLEWATSLSILIGLATTICAGLRSDAETLGSWTRPVRILAVVFPALGTAVAGLASFYGPREELLRVSQSLVTLQQLHTDLSLGLSRTPCPSNDDLRQNILKKLEGWEDKLAQLRPATSAARLGAVAKDTGVAGGNSGLTTAH